MLELTVLYGGSPRDTASSAIMLVLKMQVCSQVIDILGNNLSVRQILQVLMCNFVVRNTK